ncbi:hypothetical protein BT67DRAFT_464016 [Trichocladium antarcticum]|uniref:Uncharacterized protein n=1 Tax=Trichocladium antarcticum TaxID=1450529 RepID=A0AAN6ZBJ1_9PEZI|nr:hypothetical protein BT67DRAFT_464016 [Trichocladium antarcticum]
MSIPETEILVHIAAPSRTADDVKYRILASAYLDFEPTSRTSTTPGVGPQTREWINHHDDPRPAVGLRAIESPMLSFRSAANNFNSPRLPEAREVGTESQLSWRAPPSVIQDSMPDNVAAFSQYCTPTRILEHYTSAFDTAQSDISAVSRRDQASTSPVSSLRYRGHSSVDEDAVIPLSLSPVAGGRRPSARNRPCSPTRPTPTHPSVVEETRLSSPYRSQHDDPAPSSRAESQPPVAKRQRTSLDPEPGNPLVRSASDLGPQPHTAHAQPHQLPETLEILSPPPATAQTELRPEDMITEVLASLARELNLDRRFQPAVQTRDLRPFERGYWLVDCAAWDPALKQSAWGFLADYLGKGAAGWGTSCRRDRGFSWIRLYCWGCVAGHMYLVVYLMSRRRVLRTGTSWVGADGTAVVVMGARPGPGTT